MTHLLTLDQWPDLNDTLTQAEHFKSNPLAQQALGRGKTLGLLFFNPSLRTRMSTEKAAQNLGMNTLVLNINHDGWLLEFEDGTVMNSTSSEHIKEAAAVISQYCDIVAIRAFAELKDRAKDQAEQVLQSFMRYGSIPVVNLESATAHPLQALADALTLREYQPTHRPKVVLSWAPHPKALPQAVANSFVRMMRQQEADFVIAQPNGYALDPAITQGISCVTEQEEAFVNADFIYTKNWSSFDSYGQVLRNDLDWMITPEKMALTRSAKFMHCLPVRRNVVVADAVLDSPNSLVIEQANNRTYTVQAVLHKMLQNG
ncbi:MAG: N-acetylornithine carbamoyltransferase [Flavobacteriaceae bacterium]